MPASRPPARRTRAGCLLALALAATGAAHAAEPTPPHTSPQGAEPAPPAADEGWSLEVFDAGAAAGDVIHYRLAWTNRGPRAVSVPADLLAGLYPSASFSAGTAGTRAVSVAGRSVVSPERVDWVTLAPGESLQRIGTLGDFFDGCRRNGAARSDSAGCPAGRYELTYQQVRRVVEPLGPDQREPPIPPLAWRAQLAPPTAEQAVAVGPGPGIAVALRVARITGTTVHLHARITNRLQQPVWFPAPELWNVSARGRIDVPGEVDMGFAQVGRIGVAPPWGPDAGVLLRPGASLIVPCAVDVGELPARSHLSIDLELAPPSRFDDQAKRRTSPFYFEGRLTPPTLEQRTR